MGQFEVSAATISTTEAALREAGRRGDELFLFWSGSIADGSFHARTLHRPRQTCHKSALGLSVRIDGDALHEQARWLVEHWEILGVQIHSHPDTAYHSEAMTATRP